LPSTPDDLPEPLKTKEFPMKVLATFAAAALTLIAFLPEAHSASFSCYGNVTFTERAICDNASVSSLDSKMARLYFRLIRTSPGAVGQRIRADQIAFLANRNTCVADVTCLFYVYQDRIDDLKRGPVSY
jgi:uncharacterized protein